MDVEEKLTRFREEDKLIGTSDSLNKDQTELLRRHERHNHVISIVHLQLLVAVDHFPTRSSKCARLHCASCCCGKAHKKTCRSKGKHDRSILDRIKKLLGEVSHTHNN